MILTALALALVLASPAATAEPRWQIDGWWSQLADVVYTAFHPWFKTGASRDPNGVPQSGTYRDPDGIAKTGAASDPDGNPSSPDGGWADPDGGPAPPDGGWADPNGTP
jgi:hypothetical protein